MTDAPEEKLKKITLYMSEKLIEDVKKSAKKHRRSFSGESIFAIETYLTYLFQEANTPKHAA